MFNHMSIRTKLLGSFGIIVFLLIVCAAVAFWGINQIRLTSAAAVERGNDSSNLQLMLYYMQAQYADQADLIINGDESAIASFDEHSAIMDKYRSLAESKADHEQEKQWFKQIIELDNQFTSVFKDKVVPTYRAKDQVAIRNYDDESDRILNQMEDLVINKLMASFSSEAMASGALIESTVNTVIWVLLGSALFASILATFLGFGISRVVAGNIGKIVSVSQALSVGKLNERVEIHANDETGILAESFNNMADQLNSMLQAEKIQRERLQNTIDEYIRFLNKVGKGDLSSPLVISENGGGGSDPLIVLGKSIRDVITSLRDMLVQTSEAANDLSTASSEILAATTQQAAGTSEQSAAITQTSTTVDEVKVIAEQAGQRAQEVADASQRTLEVSRTGQQAVQETIQFMAQIKSRVESIAENILALSDRTQQIGEIIAVVNEIAAQSNILALNASVEAARAGEHGKGFAVVAAEVRDLAEQSRKATAQIKEILGEIQKATNSTVMVTEEGSKVVEKGMQLATKAGNSIEQLSAVITNSAQVAVQVSSGSRQQHAGIDQISTAIRNINQAAVQNLASTRQTEKAAQNLTELSLIMKDTVSQYKLK